MQDSRVIRELQPGVTEVVIGARCFILVGTAHVSRASVDLVDETIRSLNPDVVCVELDDHRAKMITEPERWRQTDIFEVIKSGRGYVLLAQLILAAFQKRVAKHLEVKPGEEMLRAMQVAQQLNIPLRHVDREIKITLRRVWSKAGFWPCMKILGSILLGSKSDEKVSGAEIEALKEGDALEKMLEEFDQVVPGVKSVLIDERDRYMAGSMISAPGARVLAVVGAGHVPGMLRQIGQPVNLDDLMQVPPPKLTSKLLGLTLPVLIIALLAWGFLASGTEHGMQMVVSWVLITGSLAAAGALAALAHPASIIVAFISAPITTLHPLLAAGWFSAMAEALLRKPRVEDFETVSEDIQTVKGIWRNRVSKVLLVFILTNAGSALGALLGLGRLASEIG
jgi:pheromone shutdown-related protein TraB